MYSYIRGLLVEAAPTHAIVETAGVGYCLKIPTSVFSKLPQIQNEVVLHTSFVVRELSQTLYGFLTSVERDLFETLMGMNGVGPKVALSIIGHLPLERLTQAVMKNDIVTFSKVPGIGKKTAERLIIEMRGKLDGFDIPQEAPPSSTLRDAMSALINLGYQSAAAEKALKKTMEEFSEDTDLPVLITHALKHI